MSSLHVNSLTVIPAERAESLLLHTVFLPMVTLNPAFSSHTENDLTLLFYSRSPVSSEDQGKLCFIDINEGLKMKQRIS